MANIKFSAFTQKVVTGNVDFLVGYTGADNVRISPAIFSDTYLPLAGGTMVGNLKLNDSVKLELGTNADGEFWHDGNDLYMTNTTGDMYLTNKANNKDIVFQSDDGGGGYITYMTIDGGAENVHFSKPVGIGTATPGYTLEVDGTAALATAPSYIVANETAGIFKMAIGVQNSPGVAQEAFVGTLSNTDFKIMTNSAFVGRITTTGRLLIGAGGVPEESIQAEGAIMSTGTNVTSSTAGTNRAIMDLTSGGARLGHFRGAAAAGSGSVKIYSDSVERMIITSTGLNKINSSASGDHNAYQKTGTYTKTSTGSTTAMDIVKVGHTHAVNYTVIAKIDTSNQGTLVGNTSTAYGSNGGIIVDSEAYSGVISDIAVAYDNSFYGFTVAVTYTGVTHPIIYMAVTGLSSEDFVQQ